MKNELSNKTVLIIGAGNVGEACAFRLIDHKVKKIILHTLTEKEAVEVLVRVKEYNEEGPTILETSWGDALLPESLAYKNKQEILRSKEDSKILLSYYFNSLNDGLLETSFLYSLVKKFKPDIIIDAINTATVVGYADDPYSLPRKIIKNGIEDHSIELLLSNPINPLIRFTQVLKMVMEKFQPDCYIKVSTTGLGGMGINLPYTHGDLNEPGMSSGILGKVAAAGIMHQLFWSLSHAPGCNIKVVVPAALIGWQYVGLGDFRSHGNNLREVSIPKKQNLNNVLLEKLEETIFLNKTIKIPYVDSGENNAYSLHEMMAITSLGQMESVTREEVSEAVLQSILGSTKYDILTALDYATLNPSYTAAIQRDHVFEKMKHLEKISDYPSIATNNLGPTMSKHLFELFILLKVAGNSLENLINWSPKKLIELITLFFEKDDKILKYALALRLPVISCHDEIFILDNAFVPGDKDLLKNISSDDLEKFIKEGWIDFREENIKQWLEKLQKLVKEKNNISNKMCMPLERNWQDVENGDIGEILGYIYSMEGGNRKKELQNA